jgi:hypothetical protein
LCDEGEQRVSVFPVAVDDLPSLRVERSPFDMFIDFEVYFEGGEL